jgi:hypothetical protein
MKIDIGGLSIAFNSQAQLKTSAETALATTEAKLKKAAEEFKKLRRTRRALMQFLADRPAARKGDKAVAAGA